MSEAAYSLEISPAFDMVDNTVISDDRQPHVATITVNRFSREVQAALHRAHRIAESMNHQLVCVEHFILALFAEESSREIMRRRGYTEADNAARDELHKKFARRGVTHSPVPGPLNYSANLKHWISGATERADKRGLEYRSVSVDDFVIAVEKALGSSDTAPLNQVRSALFTYGDKTLMLPHDQLMTSIQELKTLQARSAKSLIEQADELKLAVQAGTKTVAAALKGLDARKVIQVEVEKTPVTPLVDPTPSQASEEPVRRTATTTAQPPTYTAVILFAAIAIGAAVGMFLRTHIGTA